MNGVICTVLLIKITRQPDFAKRLGVLELYPPCLMKSVDFNSIVAAFKFGNGFRLCFSLVCQLRLIPDQYLH